MSVGMPRAFFGDALGGVRTRGGSGLSGTIGAADPAPGGATAADVVGVASSGGALAALSATGSGAAGNDDGACASSAIVCGARAAGGRVKWMYAAVRSAEGGTPISAARPSTRAQ